jgi:hypothetical protein
MSKPPIELGNIRIGKECGGRWFPYAGRGYWDGFRFFFKHPINLKFRTYQGGFAIGPLMIWDETKVKKVRWNPKFDPKYLEFVSQIKPLNHHDDIVLDPEGKRKYYGLYR